MMSDTKAIRYQALLFLRGIAHMFNTDESFAVEAYFSTFACNFKHEIAFHLEIHILAICTKLASIFAAHASSFLWEAVRCILRSMASKRSGMLMPSRNWAIKLMKPWCKFIDFTDLAVESVNVHFFSFIVDSLIDGNSDVTDCWTELCGRQVNAAILFDTLLNIHARFNKSREICIELASRIFVTSPAFTAELISHPLGYSGSEWCDSKPNNHFDRESNEILKNYFKSRDDVSSPSCTLRYETLQSQAAVSFAAQLILLDFKPFIPHIPIIIIAVIRGISGNLCEMSPCNNLLRCLVHGLVNMAMTSQDSNSSIWEPAMTHIRKLLGWFEMENLYIVWDMDAHVGRTDEGDISVIELLDRLIWIIQSMDGIAVDANEAMVSLASECLNWLKEGFLV